MQKSSEALTIADLMNDSGVKFGTSGARGLAAAMTDRVCYAYTSGFLQFLAGSGEIRPGNRVAIAGDLRASTPRIMAAAARAIRDGGFVPVNCGFIPTPAVALYGLRHGIASLMVTGSHIPDDRNGIKFYRATGEILKRHEAAIKTQRVAIPAGVFDRSGCLVEPFQLPAATRDACHDYLRRYLDLFPEDALQGLRIGLYEHSSVARVVLGEVLEGLGAEVVRLGRSDAFIPVDTEAVRPQDVALARQWADELALDSVVSTDGDGDRPLVSDEQGNWLRGDVAGVLSARYLGIHRIVTPVSSNSLVERCGWFAGVERTRIGSPFVIEAMDRALEQGDRAVAGYEANGGFLTADELILNGAPLSPLPTRDAVIVIVAVLLLARREGRPLSGLLAGLPPRYTSSGRLQAFPSDISRRQIAALSSGDFRRDSDAVERLFGGRFGAVQSFDHIDGLRITFQNGEVVHLRPSGNAPELRCYNEADSPKRAEEMNRICLEILERWRQ